MQESTEPTDTTPAKGKTEITPIIAHPLALAIFLSLIFSFAGLFLIVIVPHELNRFLENYISDP